MDPSSGFLTFRAPIAEIPSSEQERHTVSKSVILLLSGAIVVGAATGGALIMGVPSPGGDVSKTAPTPGTRQPNQPATPTTTLLSTSEASPIPQRTPLMLTAQVNPATAAGSVQFKDGSANIGDPVPVTNGSASQTTSTLAVGQHQLTAVFTPANPAAFGPSTSQTVPFVISGAAPTDITLSTSMASPVPQNTPLTLTAALSPATATGTVQFRDGANNLGDPVPVTNGSAQTTATLAAGQHQLTAVFTPTDPALFAPATSSPEPIQVSGATATTTTLSASSATTPAVQGSTVTLTATVSPSEAAGTVQFRDGGNNIGDAVAVTNGTATTTTTTLPVGTRQLTAVFTPTNATLFSSSTSQPETFVVGGPTATSTTLAADPDSPVREDTPVTLTARLNPSTAAGTVQFQDGDNNIGGPVTVTNGMAMQTTQFEPGTHPLSAVFTPANTALFSTSTSQEISYEVNAEPVVDAALAVVPDEDEDSSQRFPVSLKAATVPDPPAGHTTLLTSMFATDPSDDDDGLIVILEVGGELVEEINDELGLDDFDFLMQKAF